MMVGRFFRNHLLWPAAGDCSCEKKHKRWYRIVRIVAHGAQRTKSPDRLHRVNILKLGKNSPARRACTHGGLLGLVQEKDSKERGPALSLFESFVTSHQTKITAYLLHRLVARVINNRFQPSIPASSAMTISRVLSIAARRAPVARSSVVANVAHRGFAVAACQQLHNSRGESATSPRVGALLAAASAAMGASAVLGNDHADCCGIAGVVGGSGDAR